MCSRLSEAKLVFQPYNMDQLKIIVRDRLEGTTLVDGIAIDQVARKVAAETGEQVQHIRPMLNLALCNRRAARE